MVAECRVPRAFESALETRECFRKSFELKSELKRAWEGS